MAASTTTVVALALPLLLTLHLPSPCEAAIVVGSAGAAPTWRGSEPLVRSPDEMSDFASFMFEGSELHRSASPSMGAKGAGALLAPARPQPTEATTPREVPPAELTASEDSGSDWEATFAAGVSESKKATEAEDSTAGSWVSDSSGDSGAAVPARMLNAEVLLEAAEVAPADRWKEKTAQRALHVYYHAKWLAERNYARAAEHRYREAARLARASRRTVLASHSLARLGYFLVRWGREHEATEVLEESMNLNSKSNPLAPYLHGQLERKVAGGDIERLRVAEDLILNSGEQPSEELELERSRLIEEISFWREAESSPRHCAASSDPGFILICLCGHAVAFLRQVLFH